MDKDKKQELLNLIYKIECVAQEIDELLFGSIYIDEIYKLCDELKELK